MKILFAACVLLTPLVASAALVDPRLQNFARGVTGSSSVILLFQAPARQAFPLRAPPSLIRRALADQVGVAWTRVQASVSNEIARGEIQLVHLHSINLSAVVRVTPQALRVLAQTPGIDKIYANSEVNAAPPVSVHPTNRSQAGLPYDLAEIALDQVLKAYPTLNGQGVLVGHIDTGIDGRHPSLAGKIPLFYDATKQKVTEPFDAQEHGTHTAGTVVGGPKDGFPMGIAPGAQIVGVAGLTDYDSMLRGMAFLLNPDGKVESNKVPRLVTNSWNTGGAPDQELFYRAIDAWEAASIFTVFSAGNAGPNPKSITPPHEHPMAYAVAASGPGGVLASFSSRGPGVFRGQPTQKPDVTAPGVKIVSAVPGGGFKAMSGTSMAAPHVAGLAALLYQAAPQLTTNQIRNVITRSADFVDETGQPQSDPKWNANFGWGKINALKAVNLVKQLLSGQRLRWATLLAPAIDLQSGFSHASRASGPLDIEADRATDLFSVFETDRSRWIDGASL